MSEKPLSERLAVIETRCEALPKIEQKIDAIQTDLSGLKVRVAGVASAVALVVTFLVELIVKFLH